MTCRLIYGTTSFSRDWKKVWNSQTGYLSGDSPLTHRMGYFIKYPRQSINLHTSVCVCGFGQGTDCSNQNFLFWNWARDARGTSSSVKRFSRSTSIFIGLTPLPADLAPALQLYRRKYQLSISFIITSMNDDSPWKRLYHGNEMIAEVRIPRGDGSFSPKNKSIWTRRFL